MLWNFMVCDTSNACSMGSKSGEFNLVLCLLDVTEVNLVRSEIYAQCSANLVSTENSGLPASQPIVSGTSCMTSPPSRERFCDLC